MTLIAAFKQNDVPILLGDFLLTGFDDTWGTRKKSHLISKNFVVAWTGSRLAASTVLRELNSQFREQNVTRAGVEDFFTNYDTSQLGALEVHLVGWIIDDGPHCFLWNNLYPHELFYDSSHVDGSGAPAFKRLLKRKLESRGSVGDSKIKQAIFYSLSKYATLIGHEIVGLNHQLHFGFGFELLYFDGEQFKFVDDILCVGFDIFYDVRTSVIYKTPPHATYKYRSFTDYSVVQINFPSENRTQVFVITRVFDDMPDLLDQVPGLNRTTNQTLSVSSAYYCLFYSLRASDGLATNGSLVYGAGSAKESDIVRVVKVPDEGERIEFDFGFVREIYRRMRALADAELMSKAPGKPSDE